MAVWGGFTNHLRIGLDVWTDPYDTYTPSINVYQRWYVQCDSSWNFNDSQTLVMTGPQGDSRTFQNTLGPNGIVAVLDHTIFGQGQSYAGGPTYTFSANLQGVYLGAGPSFSWAWALPARPIRVTNPTSTPSMTPPSGSDTGLTFNWNAPTDQGGSAPDTYEVQVARDAGFGAVVADFNSSVGGITAGSTYGAPLLPGTPYYGRVRAHNAAGWSGWSGTGAGTTTAYPTTCTLTSTAPDTATVSWAAKPGGDSIQGFNVQVATDAGFTAGVRNLTAVASASSLTVTGLTPGTAYYARVAVSQGGSGAGAWSATSTTQTLSGAKVYTGGTWHNAVAYVASGGTWHTAKVNKRVSGAWQL